MVVALSRFKVANGMEQAVGDAFRQRPRAVESAPGFLWLEVFVDAGDRSIFYLLTRWTDRGSFESWHDSPAHRDSHALIPKGLKLDAAWTEVFDLERIDGTTGTAFTDAIADAMLLVAAYAAAAEGVFFFVLEGDGRIRLVNAWAAEQLDPDRGLIGRPLFDYMPAADAARFREILRRPQRSNAPVRLNFAATRGLPFTLDCFVDVRRDAVTLVGQSSSRHNQQLQQELLAINQDLAALSRERSREVRDERSGRESAEKLNRERTAFLSVLAHELKQPLNGALAAMAVMKQINPDPNLERPHTVLERQLRQANRLVEDLADVARLAGGEIELRRDDVDVAQQLRDLTPGWEAVAAQTHKSFAHDITPGRVMVWGEAERLQQVFSNLVGNALKYTPPGRGIRISLHTEGEHAVFSVRDEGEGIPADRLSRIFEMFQRATTTGSGLGIGLGVVQALVEAHGGEVTAASEGEGRGATFTVRLPLHRDS